MWVIAVLVLVAVVVIALRGRNAPGTKEASAQPTRSPSDPLERIRREWREDEIHQRMAAEAPTLFAKPKRKVVVVDGSNLVHDDQGKCRPEQVRALGDALRSRVYDFVIYFDANIAYKICGDPAEAREFNIGRAFGLKPEEFVVVPAGSQADDFFLMAADREEAIVITNDLLRPYVHRYAWTREAGRVARWSVSRGRLMIPAVGIDVPLCPADQEVER